MNTLLVIAYLGMAVSNVATVAHAGQTTIKWVRHNGETGTTRIGN